MPAKRAGANVIRFLIIAAGLLLAIPARADGLDAALNRFAADDFSETETAIAEIAASGAPNAQAILEALSARRLLFAENRVVYQTEDGSYIDARTGKPAEGGDDLSPVRINNNLRGVIEAALGSLTLMSPDPGKRLQAAEAILKSHDAKAIPALDQALARETDAAVRQALLSARGSAVLAAPESTEEEQLIAVEALRTRGSQEALALLRGALPSIQSPKVQDAIQAAAESIESRLKLLSAAQNVWYGLSLGSVLLLTAIGLAITFGVMGVINMAHGEMVMLGAYTTFVVQEFFRAHAPGLFGFSLPVAIPMAFLVTALIGIAIERGIIRYLYGRPLETLLATWGVSLFLQQAVRTRFGPTNQDVASPGYMSGAFDFMGLQITYGRFWIVLFTLAVFAGFLAIYRLTRLGLQMRAVTQNRRMASSMGINTPWVDAMTFGLGSGIAGIAGVALSQIDNVSPNLGQTYIIDSFMVVVFGGVGSLWGTLVSAFALGIANKLLEPAAGAVLAKIAILVLLIFFIQKRPRGLFALRGRAVEA
jgi:urea transport system permease protein